MPPKRCGSAVGEAVLIILALAWIDHAINTVIDRLMARQQPVHEGLLAPPAPSVDVAAYVPPVCACGYGSPAFMVLEHVYGISAGCSVSWTMCMCLR